MGTVIKKPLSEVKSKLNEFIRLVELEGVEVVLLRHGHECARIVPTRPPAETPRLKGFGRDLLNYDKGADLEIDESAWGEIEIDGEKIKLR
jgi:antitoxin (DNA-binding transcriptional repressor) of toxin-antitoxin stability system